MKNNLFSAVVAAGLAAGLATAHAQATSDAPLRAGEASTFTGGAPNLLTTNSPYPDGTVVLHSYAYSYPALVAAPVYPVAVPGGSLPPSEPLSMRPTDATPTSNVPSGAGEASTLTNGVPNLVTQNHPGWPVAQAYVPHYPYGYVWQR